MDQNNMPLFEPAEPMAEKPKRKAGSIQVVLIQSACCAVFLLLFWLFKVLGGSAYEQLKNAFYHAFQNNALLATVAGLFDEKTPDNGYVMQGGTTGTAATSAAGGTTAATGETSAGTTASVGTTGGTAATVTGAASQTAAPTAPNATAQTAAETGKPTAGTAGG